MKLLSTLFKFQKKLQQYRKINVAHKEEALIKVGRDQFKKLLDKGLTVPVALL